MRFEKSMCFVALIWPSPSCGFLPLEGSLADTHNCTWVSWGSWTPCLKLDQESLSPHFPSPSGGAMRNQISSIKHTCENVSLPSSLGATSGRMCRNTEKVMNCSSLFVWLWAFLLQWSQIKAHIFLIMALLILYVAFIKTLKLFRKCPVINDHSLGTKEAWGMVQLLLEVAEVYLFTSVLVWLGRLYFGLFRVYLR